MREVLAVDPGEKFCGLAGRHSDGSRFSLILTPERTVAHVRKRLAHGVRVLVLEDWKLYPWVAVERSWDRLQEVRLLGVLEYLGREAGVEVVFQGADVMKAAARMWEKRGGEWVSAKGRGKGEDGDHARAAETHLVYWLMRNEAAQRRQIGERS